MENKKTKTLLMIILYFIFNIKYLNNELYYYNKNVKTLISILNLKLMTRTKIMKNIINN